MVPVCVVVSQGIIPNMKVVAIQLNTVWEDKHASHQRVETLLGSVEPGTLVVLPEMFSTGFSTDLSVLVEEEGCGDSQRFLASVASRHRCWVIGGVVVPAPDGRGWNQAVGFDPSGEPFVRYTKVHPFTFGGETAIMNAGESARLVEVADMKICPVVCYDLRFPELFRWGARRGAELFVVIANWPAPRQDHWRTLAKARAIENQAWVVAVNRCGTDPNHAYAGGSAVFDPRGTMVADAGSAEVRIEAECDPVMLHAYRREFPALLDMRHHLFATPYD